MAKLIIEIPDEYLPGIEAAKHTANSSGFSFSSIEEFSSHTAVEAAKSWCIQYKVGAYWVKPRPEFNQDGTPYVVNREIVNSEDVNIEIGSDEINNEVTLNETVSENINNLNSGEITTFSNFPSIISDEMGGE